MFILNQRFQISLISSIVLINTGVLYLLCTILAYTVLFECVIKYFTEFAFSLCPYWTVCFHHRSCQRKMVFLRAKL